MVDQGLREFKVVLPMRVKTSSKKKQALNLNVYRNLHHRSLHAQKKKFEELAKKLLRDIPPLGVITLHYEVCVETKRRLDIMNVGSIIDKYFSDSLTACGVIRDDDYKHIPRVSFSFGGFVDKEHVLVTIIEIEPREDTPMRVLLDNDDIQRALTTYVSTLNIPDAAGVSITVNDEGELTAEVLFGTAKDNLPTTDPADPPEPKKRGRGGRPRGSKNLPKTDVKEASDVDTTVSDGPSDSGGGDTASSEGTTVADDTVAPTENDEPSEAGTKKGNLFGDKGTQSSETDGSADDTPDSAPAPEPVKRGSIFDA